MNRDVVPAAPTATLPICTLAALLTLIAAEVALVVVNAPVKATLPPPGLSEMVLLPALIVAADAREMVPVVPVANTIGRSTVVRLALTVIVLLAAFVSTVNDLPAGKVMSLALATAAVTKVIESVARRIMSPPAATSVAGRTLSVAGSALNTLSPTIEPSAPAESIVSAAGSSNQVPPREEPKPTWPESMPSPRFPEVSTKPPWPPTPAAAEIRPLNTVSPSDQRMMRPPVPNTPPSARTTTPGPTTVSADCGSLPCPR